MDQTSPTNWQLPFNEDMDNNVPLSTAGPTIVSSPQNPTIATTHQHQPEPAPVLGINVASDSVSGSNMPNSSGQGANVSTAIEKEAEDDDDADLWAMLEFLTLNNSSNQLPNDVQALQQLLQTLQLTNSSQQQHEMVRPHGHNQDPLLPQSQQIVGDGLVGSVPINQDAIAFQQVLPNIPAYAQVMPTPDNCLNQLPYHQTLQHLLRTRMPRSPQQQQRVGDRRVGDELMNQNAAAPQQAPPQIFTQTLPTPNNSSNQLPQGQALQQLLRTRMPSSPQQQQMIGDRHVGNGLMNQNGAATQQAPPQVFTQTLQTPNSSLNQLPRHHQVLQQLLQMMRFPSSSQRQQQQQMVRDKPVGNRLMDQNTAALRQAPSHISAQTLPTLDTDNNPNESTNYVQVLQQFLQTFRLPSSPQQRDQILQILRTNPKLLAAFIERARQRQQSYRSGQQSRVDRDNRRRFFSLLLRKRKAAAMAEAEQEPSLNNNPNQLPPHRQAFQQLLASLRLPNSPQQQEPILQIMETNHQPIEAVQEPTLNNNPNRQPLHRQAFQQLLADLRLPNSPQQQAHILQIIGANPQLKAAFLRQRQRQQQR